MTVLDDDDVRARIRLLAGVEAEEMSDADVLIFITMAKEWFGEQVGSAFSYGDTIDAYNNSIVYYACYLASIAQNGLGVESMKLGDFFIQYDTIKGFKDFENKARQELMSKLGLSIKTGTYNADPHTGDVDWKKNIDGSDATLTMKPTPANTRS